MSSDELTYVEVAEVRRPAVCVTPAALEDRHDHEIVREWRYEDDFVWLLHRDEQHTYSMRVAMTQEIPQSGWRHEGRCDCRYCAGAGVRPSAGPISRLRRK